MTIATAKREASGRDELLRLGRAGDRPWVFLAPAAAAIERAPQDHELRLLIAANLAALGLPTLAGAALAGLPDDVQAGAGAAEVRAAIRELPDDLLAPDALESVCRGNIEAMGAAGAPTAAPLPAWSGRMRAQQWYAARDGNIVRRARDDARPWTWHGLSEQKQAAETLAAKLAQAEPRPITLEGADPPWLLAALARTPARADGHRVRVSLVQADPLELLDGLALVDLREPLRAGQIEVFTGEGVARRLGAALQGRLGARIRGHAIALPGVARRVAPPVSEVLETAAAGQQQEARALWMRAQSMYAGRDRAWWRRRYADARAGSGGAGGAGPLRVLVPACRYSTFVRHASAALVRGFAHAGCSAEILIEPDEFTHLSTVAYLRAVVDLEPDLVVLTNYTRAGLGQALPPNLPVVTWIQDAMAHLLDPKMGAQQGEFDFLAGHLLPELFDRFGYPRERALAAPVVVDPEKFHDAPVAQALRERYACEVALVSHHGEPPEALHARLVSRANADPRLAGVCEALRPRVEDVVTRSREANVHHELRAAIAEVVEGAFEPAVRPRAEALALHQYALPMADRLLRHETVAWAADLCAREGWRLRIYGRGWAEGQFAEYARGEIEHGEDLRACYQAATAHLHASISTAVHQRVMECALSGGLPLVRLHRGLAYGQLARAHAAVARRGGLTRADDRWEAAVADHPEYLAAASQLQRLGYPVPPRVGVPDAVYQRLRDNAGSAVPVAADASDLLGDLAATCFLGREDLERTLRCAVEQPRWRRAASDAIAGRVRRRWTTDVLAREMVELVGRSLG